MAETNIGKVVQVIGPVLDVAFDPEHLPDIYNALSVESSGGNGSDVRLIVEVQQHIGRGMVRTVAMTSTDGVTRGMDVVDTGSAITVPVGPPALGRILNVLGEPVDEQGPVVAEDGEVERWPNALGEADRFAYHHLPVATQADFGRLPAKDLEELNRNFLH